MTSAMEATSAMKHTSRSISIRKSTRCSMIRLWRNFSMNALQIPHLSGVRLYPISMSIKKRSYFVILGCCRLSIREISRKMRKKYRRRIMRSLTQRPPSPTSEGSDQRSPWRMSLLSKPISDTLLLIIHRIISYHPIHHCLYLPLIDI